MSLARTIPTLLLALAGSGLAAQCVSPITAFPYLEDFENAAA